MPNNIIHVGVHDLRRTASGLEIVLGQTELPASNTTQRVVDALDEKYNRKSSKAHGRFSDDHGNYPTAGYFEAYLDEAAGGDFADLTHRLMTTLLAKAQRAPNAGAGHVFFAHFEREGREFVLIAIVNEKLGAALTNEFEVQDVTHLDLDGFRFAGRVDITSWRADEERYIGFLRGRGEVAKYFKEFLGCMSSMTDKRSTEEFVTALKDFADGQAMVPAARDDFMVRAKGILDRTARTNEQLDFQEFANELVPTDPAVLAEYLGESDRQLGDGFVPNVRVIGTLVKFRARTPHWSIEIERSAIREGEIVFDAQNNTLTITALPDELAAELRAEFADYAEG